MTREAARNELGRRICHALFGLPAFVLPLMDWRLGAAIASVALVANLEFLPRTTIGRSWLRPDEGRLGGIVLYPLTVLLLVLVFRDRLDSAAMGWAVLAFGDPAAAVVGRGARRRWPWNPSKSRRGSAAFVIAASCAGLLLGLLQGESPVAALLFALPPALLGAAVESLPRPRDDNLTVGFAGALGHLLVRSLS